ncbi:MAG: tetratricopeptide repeat protein [Planctomycetes bacterium]|nr:tetratricopeptide repeat protein [Planctomycetota bacterium]
MNAPTGTVTIVFTDIEDSTALWERHGRAFESCLSRHNEILRELIAANAGYEVKTEGDAFMVAFQRAGDAITFARQAQLKLHDETWPDPIAVLVRMGMHTGEPIAQPDPASGRTDYFGPVVNRAARVGAAGHGGQILLSEATCNAARDAFGDAIVTELGEHLLKGMERPEKIFQLTPPRLAHRSFAPLQTISALQTNLPPQSTSFIGRRREVEELLAMLAPRKGDSSAQTKLLRARPHQHPDLSAGVISLIGPGGTGKTRLALRVGTEALDRYDGGVWFADLSAARGATDAAAEVAHALGVRLAGNDDPVEAVANVLQFRRPMLLVLDNFEQLAAHSDVLVGEWRRRAPHVTFMITTRALLGLKGEQEYELRPMSAPEGDDVTPEQLMRFESVALFVQRAQEADKRFQLDDRNAADVARICTDLEGIPLAVELAASRVKLMKPAQIVKRLEKKFELLKSTRRDTGMRQRTLYDALEWSFDLLTDWERSAFLQCCAFQGGFLLEAAESVTDLSAFPDAPDALDALQSLREKSLLRTEQGELETRFMMYKPIHDFGLNRLARFAERDALSRRHLAFFIDYAEHWAARLHTEDEVEALDRLDDERANLYEAFKYARDNDATEAVARLALATAELLLMRGPASLREEFVDAGIAAAGDDPALRVRLHVAQARARHEVSNYAQSLESAETAAALAADQAPEVQATAYRQLSHGLWMMSRFDDSSRAAATAFEKAEQSGSPLLLSQSYGTLGIMSVGVHDYDQAVKHLTRAIELADEIGDLSGSANHLSNLGLVQGRLRLHLEALNTYARAKEIFDRLGNRTGSARMIANAGAQHQLLKRFDKARAAYEEGMRINRETGHKHGVATCAGNLGMLLTSLGNTDEARPYLEEALRLSLDIGALPLIQDHYGQWARWYESQGDIENALKYWQLSVEYDRKLNDLNKLAGNLSNVAFHLFFTGKHEEAFAAFKEARRICGQHGNERDKRRVEGSEARCRYQLGDLDQAEQLLRKALSLVTDAGLRDPGDLLIYNSLLAEIREQKDDPTGAREFAALALQAAEAADADSNTLHNSGKEALAVARRIAAHASS